MDVNPVAVIGEVLTMAQEYFSEFKNSAPSENEKQLAKKVFKSFHSILNDYVFEEESSLDVDPVSQILSQASVFDDAGLEISPAHSDGCTLERKKEILKLIADNPSWGLKTIQKHGKAPEYKYSYYKKRWEDQIIAGGTKYEKLKQIDETTLEKFSEARSGFKCVRETDLRLWALQASQCFQDQAFSFKASTSWITRFKQKHGITSRKVTKLVTKRETKSLEMIQKSAMEFQNEIRAVTPSFRKDLIINTDQVGFTYEYAGNRTLSNKGEKITMALAKSPTNLATHSYTAQYVISMDGQVIGDVFLCLQERSGRLGNVVERNLFPASNVTVTCSTSGKLTTSLYEYFLDQVIVKNMKENFLFIVDSWGGQTDAKSYASRFGVNGNPSCNLKIIPKRCTSLCQPLDTTFHRQLKFFTKKIYAEAMLYYSEDVNPTDEITTRNNIIRLHSLVHNQFCAPAFREMIKYSWFSSGLTQEKPMFDSVKEVCFSFQAKELNCSENCENQRFMKCSHCKKNFCFPCFFYKYHFH